MADESHEKYNHPVLTDAQVETAKAAARKKAEAARVKSAQELLEKEETQRLMTEEGITSGGPLNDMVEITLDLAPASEYIAINGKRYLHGRKYTVRRAVANDLLWIQDRGHENERARLGQDRFAFYQRKRAPEIKHVGGKVIANG